MLEGVPNKALPSVDESNRSPIPAAVIERYDAVLGMARQLTTDENTVNKLYEARAAADADRLKFQRELMGKQFQSGLDTNRDITVEKYRQGGRMALAQFNQGQQAATQPGADDVVQHVERVRGG